MDPELGESACYLALVDNDGALIEPRHRVFLAESKMKGESDSSWITVSTQVGDPQGDLVLPELAPLPHELVEAYRSRLAQPLCRTALWRIVLMSESRSVAISLPGCEPGNDMATVLMQSVWGLMS